MGMGGGMGMWAAGWAVVTVVACTAEEWAAVMVVAAAAWRVSHRQRRVSRTGSLELLWTRRGHI